MNIRSRIELTNNAFAYLSVPPVGNPVLGLTSNCLIDVGTGGLVLDAGATALTSPSLTTMLANGASGSTTAPRIISSAAQTSPRADGVASATLANAPAIANLGPLGIDNNDLAITYALQGDANLDRTVNFADLLILAANYNQVSNRQWHRGDFNYDNSTNFPDLLSLAGNYNQTLTSSTFSNSSPLFGRPLRSRTQFTRQKPASGVMD
jgi:hypothetical protein